ncbi:MAG: EfeM/EfeO family lipoprotein [Geodermatophilaceae bacterium]|nr:EfeM/EfeO family lipoprotein [Geodermatophilaceae bacterium]
MSLRPVLTAGLSLALLLGVSACSDDGTDVRADSSEASATDSGSGSEAESGSGSGSGSGLAEGDNTGFSDDPEVNAAAVEYRDYVIAQVDELLAATTLFTDAVRAGDVAQAQALYAPSRQPWERIEPVAGLIPDIDVAVDARVDDFASPDDPAWTGWHRLEYLLWEQNTTEGAAELADRLDTDLAGLASQLRNLPVAPLAAARGAGELVQEVSEGKITGEEDRYSHTDLWDFAANIEGAQAVLTAFSPSLQRLDPDLLAGLEEKFTAVTVGLTPYQDGAGGYVSYEELTEADKTALQAALATLSEDLALMPAALGLG